MAQTLHSGSTAPGNGKTVSVVTGNHTISCTVAGAGAVYARVQAFRKESGCLGGPVGDPFVASGTTVATATLAFTANASDVWVQLIDISPASAFTATIEETVV